MGKSRREGGDVSFRTMQNERKGRSVSHPGIVPVGIHRGPARYRDASQRHLHHICKRINNHNALLLSKDRDKVEFRYFDCLLAYLSVRSPTRLNRLLLLSQPSTHIRRISPSSSIYLIGSPGPRMRRACIPASQTGAKSGTNLPMYHTPHPSAAFSTRSQGPGVRSLLMLCNHTRGTKKEQEGTRGALTST